MIKKNKKKFKKILTRDIVKCILYHAVSKEGNFLTKQRAPEGVDIKKTYKIR